MQERIAPASKCVPQQSIMHWKVRWSLRAMLHLLYSAINVQEISLHESSHCKKCRRKVHPNDQLHTERLGGHFTSSVTMLCSLHRVTNE